MRIAPFRAFIFYSGYLSLIILNSTLYCLFWFLPKAYRQTIETAFVPLMMAWLKITCHIDIVVHGKENIQRAPCVVLCNHQSSWETFYLQHLFRPTNVIVKKELLWIPFFGWALALSKAIAISRSKPVGALRQVLHQGKKCLQRGNNVIIYPEGSRSPSGSLAPFKSSAAALAKSAGVAIVPVVHDAGLCWPAHQFVKRAGTITIHIGQPIASDTASAKELTCMAHTWCAKMLHLKTET
ncbi:MAG TPA: 1-acyl-sn-glycerol-3-phosphate acyltransferase [Porticoccaceae bacterium]|nr:1-acyl-sn-glycerol-3-phosphate acyltransferase [Porticoccaceae bacterium]